MHLAYIDLSSLFNLMCVVIKDCTSGCQHLSPDNQSISHLIKKQYANKIYLIISWISIWCKALPYSVYEIMMLLSLSWKNAWWSFMPIFNAIQTFTCQPFMCIWRVLILRCDKVARAEEWKYVPFFSQRMPSKGNKPSESLLKGIVLSTANNFEVKVIVEKQMHNKRHIAGALWAKCKLAN